MDGIGSLIALLLSIMLGPPIIFLIIALGKRKTDRKFANVFFILAVAWLIIGGGICATLLGY